MAKGQDGDKSMRDALPTPSYHSTSPGWAAQGRYSRGTEALSWGPMMGSRSAP